jgi:hypothetical protein
MYRIRLKSGYTLYKVTEKVKYYGITKNNGITYKLQKILQLQKGSRLVLAQLKAYKLQKYAISSKRP